VSFEQEQGEVIGIIGGKGAIMGKIMKVCLISPMRRLSRSMMRSSHNMVVHVMCIFEATLHYMVFRANRMKDTFI
jgi:ABC-type polysaccharide/polyol phosphate transport system ATPase subunit